MTPKLNPVIVALDQDTASEAKAMVSTLAGAVDFYKINTALFTRAGPAIVRFLKENSKIAHQEENTKKDIWVFRETSSFCLQEQSTYIHPSYR